MANNFHQSLPAGDLPQRKSRKSWLPPRHMPNWIKKVSRSGALSLADQLHVFLRSLSCDRDKVVYVFYLADGAPSWYRTIEWDTSRFHLLHRRV